MSMRKQTENNCPAKDICRLHSTEHNIVMNQNKELQESIQKCNQQEKRIDKIMTIVLFFCFASCFVLIGVSFLYYFNVLSNNYIGIFVYMLAAALPISLIFIYKIKRQIIQEQLVLHNKVKEAYKECGFDYNKR